MNILLLLATCSAFAVAAPAAAQSVDHSQHSQSARPSAGEPNTPSTKADASCPPEHAAMGHCTPAVPADAHAGHHSASQVEEAAPQSGSIPVDPDCLPEYAVMGHCTLSSASGTSACHDMTRSDASGTALMAGNATAPAPTAADYADRIWGRETMAPARASLQREHGGMSYSQVMLNIAEAQFRDGRDGYRWEGEAWLGGDINRLTIKSEGEGVFRDGVGSAEIQVLYGRAIGPYFNLQAGIRQDFQPKPSRTYVTLGFEGLAPYWFEVEGALFLSDKGDLVARLEGYYDQRITQRLLLQPRAEINLSAQDMRAEGIGDGLVDAELGLRLRYEVVREFAPYIGVSWERKFGDTARFARDAGEGTGGFSFIAGIRAWF